MGKKSDFIANLQLVMPIIKELEVRGYDTADTAKFLRWLADWIECRELDKG